jgi:hypothetical protein
MLLLQDFQSLGKIKVRFCGVMLSVTLVKLNYNLHATFIQIDLAASKL